MQGGKNRQPLGYTIVEVLIVLAISAFMFLIAANFINGKQEHTSFVQGTNEMVSRLQDTVEQVTDGHYSDIGIACTAPGGALNINLAATQQGQNQECVFLGKIIHFYSASPGQPPANYEIISMADSRLATSANWNSSATGIENLTTQGTVPQNLEVQRMKVVDSVSGMSDYNAYNVGFTQGLGTADALAPTDPNAPPYQSGTQAVGLIYASSILNQNSPIGSGNEKNITGATHVKMASSAILCLSDGTRAAEIFIGGTSNNNSQLSIRVQQLGRVACPVIL